MMWIREVDVKYLNDKKVRVNGKPVEFREFTDQNGETRLIGMSREIQDILELPFQAFEDMTERIKFLQGNKRYLEASIVGLDTTVKELEQENKKLKKQLDTLRTGKVQETDD